MCLKMIVLGSLHRVSSITIEKETLASSNIDNGFRYKMYTSAVKKGGLLMCKMITCKFTLEHKKGAFSDA